MKKKLRILILEDLQTDADLEIRELRTKAHIVFTSKKVDTREDFLKGLIEFQPDIILSDYILPEFTGMEALQIAKEKTPSIPFIIVTGSMNEETAVECMKAGAWDYVTKDHLKHLGPAIKGALEKKRQREENEQLEKSLNKACREWRTTFDAINEVILLLDLDGKIIRCNKAMTKFVGKPFKKIIGHYCYELIHNAKEPIPDCPLGRMQKSLQRETMLLHRDGGDWFDINVDPWYDDERLTGVVHIMNNITEKKR